MLKNFTVEDITFRKARKQSRVAEELRYEEKQTQPENGALSDVPQAPVIERAIRYYEEHAKGEYKILYSSTADWLREYLVCYSLKEKETAKKVMESEETVEEVDYNE